MELGALQSFANTEVTGLDVEERPRSPASGPPAARSTRETSSSSAAASGAARSPRWPAPRSRSCPRSTRWWTSARCRSSRRWTTRSPTRSSATWTPRCTRARAARTSRSGRTRTRRSPVQPEDIPSNEQAAMSPTELPFTPEHFDPYVETVLELYPTIVGNEKVGIKHAINGLMSFVPDGMSLLGETPEVKGLWTLLRRLDQGGAVHLPHAGGVDDRREARHGPGVGQHRALLRHAEDARSTSRTASASCSRSSTGSSTRSSSGRRTATSASAPRTTGMSSWAASSSRSPAGSARTGTGQRAAPRGVRRPAHGPDARVGPPLVVAHHQRRAPRAARARRHRREPGLRRVGRLGPGRGRLAPVDAGGPHRRARGQVRLHADAQRGGRHQGRRHRPAPGRVAVTAWSTRASPAART